MALQLLTSVSAADVADRSELARRILSAWARYKVVHVRDTGVSDETHAFWDALLPEIGEPARLAEDATVGDRQHQRTGEIWMEVRYDGSIPDAYRHSANAQPLHTDGSYIPSFPNATCMCCVRRAPSGGETVFLDSRELHRVLAQENAELMHALSSTVVPHARSGDRRALPVIRPADDEGDFLVNWNYYCVAPDVDGEVGALRERLFAFLRDSPQVQDALVPVQLEAGDGVLWRDDRVLHGRNSFVPGEGPSRFLWKCAVEVGR